MHWWCRASIAESLKAVTQQLHEAGAKKKHLIELESDLERREDIFESQVRQSLTFELWSSGCLCFDKAGTFVMQSLLYSKNRVLQHGCSEASTVSPPWPVHAHWL